VSATENFYDDTTWSTTFPQATAPTAGNVTMTRTAAGYSGTTAAWPSWQTTSRHVERNLPLTATDVNGVVTTLHFDALGRRTSVWLDSRATTAEANDTYAYTESSTGVSGIVARQMGEQGGYATTVSPATGPRTRASTTAPTTRPPGR
jgi:YD repeat-containing protein